MATVNINCGECKQLIAVGEDDLGHHVRCPLCSQVILATAPNNGAAPPPEPPPTTPPPEPPPTAPDEPLPFESALDPVRALDEESIFSPPESSSDDIFGTVETPKIEMPPEPEPPAEPPPPAEAPAEPQVVLTAEDEASAHPSPPEPMDALGGGFQDDSEEYTASAPEPADQPWTNDPMVTHSPHAGGSAGAAAVQRSRWGGMIAIMLLIFLVPYSIIITGYLVYVLVTMNHQNSLTLERMLESYQRNKKIQRIQPDVPVPKKLRTQLGKPFRIGAVEIEPLKVTQNSNGELSLFLKVRNISPDLIFNPLPAKFAENKRHLRPYIFLEEDRPPDEPTSRRAYGAEVHWFKGPPGKQERVLDARLAPKESMTVRLITNFEDNKRVEQLLTKSKYPLLWRVHLRRGLEEIAGAEYIITCVVGVEFDVAQVKKT